MQATEQTDTWSPTYRLSDFFGKHWEKYTRKPKNWISPDQYKAVNALRSCRTAKLGIKSYACNQCGEISEQYHSCKHRFCPSCSWKETLNWAEKAHTRLLEIPHRHAVATLPHALNPLLKANYRVLSKALFRSSAKTIKDWMLARYNIKVGIMSVQHTFGEKKNWHQHIHMIVSWGGVHAKTGKTIRIESSVIPYTFISQKFRQHFLTELEELYHSNKLEHRFVSQLELREFIKELEKDNWRFHFEPPMEIPQQVINYIGRYSKRFCLSERKIESIDGEQINFRYKDYKQRMPNGQAEQKICSLHYRDFFARLLQHVPPAGFQAVRYYGIYANTSKIKGNKKEAPLHKSAATAYRKPSFCVHCNKEKEIINIRFEKQHNQSKTDLVYHKSQSFTIQCNQKHAP